MRVSKIFKEQISSVLKTLRVEGGSVAIFSSCATKAPDEFWAVFSLFRILLPYVRRFPEDEYPYFRRHVLTRSFYLMDTNSICDIEPFFRLPLYNLRYAYRPKNFEGTAFIFVGAMIDIIDKMRNKFKPGKKWVERLTTYTGRRLISSQQAFAGKCLVSNIVCFVQLDIETIRAYLNLLHVYPRLNFAIYFYNEKDACTAVEILQSNKRIFVLSCSRSMQFG